MVWATTENRNRFDAKPGSNSGANDVSNCFCKTGSLANRLAIRIRGNGPTLRNTGVKQAPSPNLRRATRKAGPAVILISVFDSKGALLRNGTGFFVAKDGRLITNWHVVDGGAHAVAKSPDGKIRNVPGILASSAEAIRAPSRRNDDRRTVPPIESGFRTANQHTGGDRWKLAHAHAEPLATETITGGAPAHRASGLKLQIPFRRPQAARLLSTKAVKSWAS